MLILVHSVVSVKIFAFCFHDHMIISMLLANLLFATDLILALTNSTTGLLSNTRLGH